jgi:K+-sensing histidine kinase KdpD
VIREQAAKLDEISERVREIRELFRRRNEQHTLSVDVIPNFVRQCRRRHPAAEIDLSMEIKEGVVIQNGSLLQLAIDEALENAVVHNDSDHPHVEVTVRQPPDSTDVLIEIADNGPGIPDEEWNVISSGRETPLAHGSGIGLWLMYWTLTALGGTVKLSENHPRGSIITYRVPHQ